MEQVIQMIDDNNCKIFAEIGVHRGRLTENIFKSANGSIQEYWAIDKWDVWWDNVISKNKEWWEAHYIYVCEMMLKYPQLRIIRSDSIKASLTFPDEYFDIVYIDACHLYSCVIADIVAWIPKVKKGGIISGHDYVEKKLGLEVIDAVNELFEDKISLLGQSVWMHKKE